MRILNCQIKDGKEAWSRVGNWQSWLNLNLSQEKTYTQGLWSLEYCRSITSIPTLTMGPACVVFATGSQILRRGGTCRISRRTAKSAQVNCGAWPGVYCFSEGSSERGGANPLICLKWKAHSYLISLSELHGRL